MFGLIKCCQKAEHIKFLKNQLNSNWKFQNILNYSKIIATYIRSIRIFNNEPVTEWLKWNWSQAGLNFQIQMIWISIFILHDSWLTHIDKCIVQFCCSRNYTYIEDYNQQNIKCTPRRISMNVFVYHMYAIKLYCIFGATHIIRKYLLINVMKLKL